MDYVICILYIYTNKNYDNKQRYSTTNHKIYCHLILTIAC